MHGGLASHQGLGREQSRDGSEERRVFAGVVVNGGLKLSQGVNETQLQLEEWPLLF